MPEWLPNDPAGLVLIGLVTAIIGTITITITARILSAVWNCLFVMHDLSALAYLGPGPSADCTENEPTDFKNAPVYIDSPDLYRETQSGYVQTYNDPTKVIGFVVGKPRELSKRQAKIIDKKNPYAGYYAELIINWDQRQNLRRWSRYGYVIQTVKPNTGQEPRSDDRYLCISAAAATDQPEMIKRVIHITDGPFRVFRQQPYAKYGFRANRRSKKLRNRIQSPLAKIRNIRITW